jgi:hypothetical protein
LLVERYSVGVKDIPGGVGVGVVDVDRLCVVGVVVWRDRRFERYICMLVSFLQYIDNSYTRVVINNGQLYTSARMD